MEIIEVTILDINQYLKKAGSQKLPFKEFVKEVSEKEIKKGSETPEPEELPFEEFVKKVSEDDIKSE